MLKNMSFFMKLPGFLVLVLASSLLTVRAQDSEKYREDYDRMQKIEKNNQPAKRADQLIVFIKERSDMDSRIRDYVNGLFVLDAKRMKAQGELAVLKDICERAIKVDPSFVQAYLYYGHALKNENKYPEAMNAFAKASLFRSIFSQEARVELDKLYRSTHRNSLVGEDKVLSDAHKELKQSK
jgi:tetratricopeptide (TPR) repeat protein